VQLLLCSAYEIGEYAMTISEQRLGKHVRAEMNMHVTVDYSNGNGGVLCVVCAEEFS
jgi:hypothetical protein